MSESGTQAARTAEATAGEETKENLQRQMDEARESISQTVTDIKDTVVDQIHSVKETVSETLDWREQFRSHPVAWCVGALSVGYVIGNSMSASLHGTKNEDHLLSHLAALGDHFADELSRQGMNILAPALTGTVLVPLLTAKLKELTGLDLSGLTSQLLAQSGVDTTPKKKARKKKAGARKQGKVKAKGKKAKSKNV